MADPEALEEASKALSFAEFLERMKEPAAADLVRSIKRRELGASVQQLRKRSGDSGSDRCALRSQLHQNFRGAEAGPGSRQHPCAGCTQCLVSPAGARCHYLRSWVAASPKASLTLPHARQNFLAKSEYTFRQHPVWSSAPAAHQAQAVEVRHATQYSQGYSIWNFATIDLRRRNFNSLPNRTPGVWA